MASVYQRGIYLTVYDCQGKELVELTFKTEDEALYFFNALTETEDISDVLQLALKQAKVVKWFD